MPSQKYSKKMLAFCLLFDRNADWTGLVCKFSEFDLSRPLIKSCMPEVNTNNTRGGGLYKKLKYLSQKYNNSFFPLFSDYWSKLSSNLRNEKDILLFKENLKPSFKPTRQKHFTYGDKRANTLHCRLRVGRSFLKSHSFAINMSSTDRCLCGGIETIQSYFFVMLFVPKWETSIIR